MFKIIVLIIVFGSSVAFMPYMQYNRALSLRASQAGAGAMGGDAESTVEMESLLDAIADRKETINRGFTTDKGIPVLGDCNNYYSGEYEGKFWHQNADQVYVYIPVSPNIQRGDIDVKFEARAVHASVEGMEPFSFPCSERVIPDGCFWVLEEDTKSADGDKYLLLDLEKRFRMINWKGLFGAAQQAELEADEATKRMEMLKRMISAKQGDMLGEGDSDSASTADDSVVDGEIVE